MDSPRTLRRRIRSISSTAQITKAMQMVAASKMRAAQDAVIASRPFVRLLYLIQREATHGMADFTHPLLETREIRRRAVILITPDKGLCGGLNSNLFRLAAEFDPKMTEFIVAGRKGAQFIARTQRSLVAEFTYGERPTVPEARAIASYARDIFVSRQVDQVAVVGVRFVNTLSQQPVVLEFLPVGEIKGITFSGVEFPPVAEDEDCGYKCEPNVEDLFVYMLSHYLTVYIYQVLLNARASEHSARMVSMKNATESAETLISGLTLAFNKLRQGNITRELLEIAGGQAE